MTERILRVLVVDDEEMIVRLLRGYLEDSGFEVRTAATGRDALAVIEGERIDAAIVDVRLPDMAGDEVVIRGAGLSPGTKFFIHTGSIDYTLSPELIAAGVDDDSVIRKPVLDMTEIRRLIEMKVKG